MLQNTDGNSRYQPVRWFKLLRIFTEAVVQETKFSHNKSSEIHTELFSDRIFSSVQMVLCNEHTRDIDA